MLSCCIKSCKFPWMRRRGSGCSKGSYAVGFWSCPGAGRVHQKLKFGLSGCNRFKLKRKFHTVKFSLNPVCIETQCMFHVCPTCKFSIYFLECAYFLVNILFRAQSPMIFLVRNSVRVALLDLASRHAAFRVVLEEY